MKTNTKKYSAEIRKKWTGSNNGMFGKHHSEETRKKISLNCKGIKRSEEAKKKISESLKKNFQLGLLSQKGEHNAFYGKKHTEELKKKISKHNREMYLNNEFKEYHRMLTKQAMQSDEVKAKIIVPMRDTSIEVKIQNYLKELGIEFFTHQYIKIKHSYHCDILVPSKNLIIECDGDYWHGNINTRKNLKNWQIEKQLIDEERTKELKAKGYNVIRLWESEINNMTIQDLQCKIEVIK